jgi:hypothetical protein
LINKIVNTITGILAKVTSPKFTEDEIGLLLAKALERRSVRKEDIVAISEMQKALREGNKNFGSGKNELRRANHLFRKSCKYPSYN